MDDPEPRPAPTPAPTPPPGPPPTAEQVFRDHGPRVYSLARRMLNSDADAEDVTQDVLLQVVRKLPTFRGESALPTWLHRITVNAALAHRQRRAARQQRYVADSLEEFLEHSPPPKSTRPWLVTPDRAALDRETQELVERSIEKLPDIYRDVYVLADVEGLPNAEIADMLGLHVGAVKSRLHRARLHMRDALAPHFEEVAAP